MQCDIERTSHTLGMTELMLDFLSARLDFPRLMLFGISLIAINIERTILIIEPVLDCLMKYSVHL